MDPKRSEERGFDADDPQRTDVDLDVKLEATASRRKQLEEALNELIDDMLSMDPEDFLSNFTQLPGE